jgi:hypothetical protein
VSKPVRAWAIAYGHGLYQGFWFTRKEAISGHCRDTGREWDYCRAERGDRVVRVTITITKPKRKRRGK